MTPTWVAAAALSAVGAGAWAGGHRDRRLLAALAALVVVSFLRFGPVVVPPDWIAPMTEASIQRPLDIVHGEGVNEGWYARAAKEALARVEVVPGAWRIRLDGIAGFHLVIGLVAGLILIVRGAARFGWPAVLLTLAVGWQPMARHALVADVPTTLGWLWLVVTLDLVAGLRAPGAAVGLAVATLALGGMRLEWTLPALGAVAGLWVGEDPSRRRLAGRLAAAVVLVATAYDCASLGRPPGNPELHYVIRALDVFDSSLLGVPFFLLAAVGPGIVALAGVGAAAALRRGGAEAGLVIGAIGLLRLYHAAAHGSMLFEHSFQADLELLRYLGVAAPLLVWTAAWGWRELSPRWTAGLVVAALIPGVPDALRAWPRSAARAQPTPQWQVWGPLDHDMQRDVRLLLRAEVENPACEVISWSVPSTGGAPFARGLAAPSVDPHPPVVDRQDPPPPADGCQIVHAGVGCLNAGYPCPLPALPPDQQALSGPWWADPAHGWHAPEGPLRVWVLRADR